MCKCVTDSVQCSAFSVHCAQCERDNSQGASIEFQTPCSVVCVVFYVQCALCAVLECDVFYVQCEVFSVKCCVVCSVLCAVCSVEV